MQIVWFLTLTMAIVAWTAPTPHPGKCSMSLPSPKILQSDVEPKEDSTSAASSDEGDESLTPMLEIGAKRELPFV